MPTIAANPSTTASSISTARRSVRRDTPDAASAAYPYRRLRADGYRPRIAAPWNSEPRPPIMTSGASAGIGYGRFTEVRVGAATDAEAKVQPSPAALARRTSGGLNESPDFQAAVLENRPGLPDCQPVLPW